MDREALTKTADQLWAAAERHARQEGVTIMEGGHDEVFWKTASTDQKLAAVADYFDATI